MITSRAEQTLHGLVEDVWRSQRIPSMYATVADLDVGPLWKVGLAQAPDTERPGPDTQFRIGSITKTLVALHLTRLHEQGRISLDDRVTDHLPDLPLGRRRLRDLLSHTGSLREDPEGPWWERATGRGGDEVLTERTIIEPLTRRYVYSNVGYAVLGDVIARVEGKDWLPALTESILEPLGMERTTAPPQAPYVRGWAVHPWARAVMAEPWGEIDAMAPAGQLWSTPDDLVRLARAVAGRRPDVLSESSCAEMRAVHAIQDQTTWDRGYGLGLEVWRTPNGVRVGNFGSIPGFRSALWMDLTSRLCVVLLANTTADPDLHSLAFAMLDACGTTPPRSDPIANTSADMHAITGWWYAGPTPVLVEETRADTVTARFGQGAPTEFRAEDGRWLCKIGSSVVSELTVARQQGAPATITTLRVGSRVLTRSPYDPAVEADGGFGMGSWQATDAVDDVSNGDGRCTRS